MKKTLGVLIIILIGSSIFPERIAVLQELEKPYYMTIKEDHLLVNDLTPKVHLYNLRNFKYKQISRKGQGPGEYPIIPMIFIYEDFFFFYTQGKCMYFSRDGSYKDEFRIKNRRTSFFRPFGKKFIIDKSNFNSNNNQWYSEISIVSRSNTKKLKHEKLLYYTEFPSINRSDGKTPLRILPDFFNFEIFDNKLFIYDNTRGLYAEIYNLEGKQIDIINLPYEKKKVPDNYEKDYLEFIKKKGGWNLYKSMHYLEIPEYFPAFYRFAVDNDKVYFLTYNEKDGKRELVVADFKGKILKKIYVPYFSEEMHTYFAIRNDKFYYIKENEDEEQWELHMEDIK